MAAAVADFRPEAVASSKIKKGGRGKMALRLVKNPDILQEVLRRRRSGQKVVGFAAETGDLERRARDKWAAKPCDMLVANRVGGTGSGFHSETNEALVFCRGGGKPRFFKRELKTLLAEKLLDWMEENWCLSGKKRLFTAEPRRTRRER
jgi:phosphopantothenoylcysteine decarboxylase/phosphopantothenate--cysteine ligase